MTRMEILKLFGIAMIGTSIKRIHCPVEQNHQSLDVHVK